MSSISSKIAPLIKINDLMTKEVKFYEDLGNPTEFCQNKDIDILPSEDFKSYMLFNKSNKNFSKEEIVRDETLSPSDSITDFIEKSRKNNLFFVIDNGEVVGVIHFCDLINSLAYVYFYCLFNEFERKIRDILIKNNLKNEDMCNWLRYKKTPESLGKVKRFDEMQRKTKLPKFQHFDLIDLINFMQNKRIGLKEKISTDKMIKVRNSIMHHKDISSRQERTNDMDKEMLYERKDYDLFLDVHDFLIEVLK